MVIHFLNALAGICMESKQNNRWIVVMKLMIFSMGIIDIAINENPSQMF